MITVFVALATGLGVLIAQYLLGPFVMPWYNDRLQKAQRRVQRRFDQRRMIESELEKGFEDLSTVRAYCIALRLATNQQFDAPRAYARNEIKWGTWRPYLIEDQRLLEQCEQYRGLIRDLRVSIASLPLAQLEASAKRAESQMLTESKTIVDTMNGLGW